MQINDVIELVTNKGCSIEEAVDALLGIEESTDRPGRAFNLIRGIKTAGKPADEHSDFAQMMADRARRAAKKKLAAARK